MVLLKVYYNNCIEIILAFPVVVDIPVVEGLYCRRKMKKIVIFSKLFQYHIQ